MGRSRIEDLREQVDEVDDHLLELLVRRARLAGAIGAAKREGGVALVDPLREEHIVERLAARAGPTTRPLDAPAIRRLWGAILGECRRVVVEIRGD